jgi:hypothetical protein
VVLATASLTSVWEGVVHTHHWLWCAYSVGNIAPVTGAGTDAAKLSSLQLLVSLDSSGERRRPPNRRLRLCSLTTNLEASDVTIAAAFGAPWEPTGAQPPVQTAATA